jgi:hypothetical protein
MNPIQLNNNDDIKQVASEIVNRFYNKESLTATEASAILAYLKFIQNINDKNEPDDTNVTFEIQV